MKTICIYHSIDLDGWMSAAIVKHWWELNTKMQEGGSRTDRIEFLSFNYSDPIPDLSEYDKVIMCDISFPVEEMNSLEFSLEYGNPESENFIWIDHHISAINDNSKRNFHGIRDTKFAACELTWRYFFPNETMPEIVRLLGRYDCFGHKGTEEELKVLEFQYGARNIISNYEEAYNYLCMYFDKERIKDENNELINSIWTIGSHIYQYLCTDARPSYKNGFTVTLWQDTIPTNEEIRSIPMFGACDICGKEGNITRHYFRYENDKCDCHSPYHFELFDCCSTCKPTAKNKVPKKFICINKERFNPINFGIDYHKDGYDGCACFHYANGKYNFSLYNDNGLVDCSLIAKQFGGGGHKGAAGFILNQEQFDQLINK